MSRMAASETTAWGGGPVCLGRRGHVAGGPLPLTSPAFGGLSLNGPREVTAGVLIARLQRVISAAAFVDICISNKAA